MLHLPHGVAESPDLSVHTSKKFKIQFDINQTMWTN